jgi:hypothetical protein
MPRGGPHDLVILQQGPGEGKVTGIKIKPLVRSSEGKDSSPSGKDVSVLARGGVVQKNPRRSSACRGPRARELRIGRASIYRVLGA